MSKSNTGFSIFLVFSVAKQDKNTAHPTPIGKDIIIDKTDIYTVDNITGKIPKVGDFANGFHPFPNTNLLALIFSNKGELSFAINTNTKNNIRIDKIVNIFILFSKILSTILCFKSRPHFLKTQNLREENSSEILVYLTAIYPFSSTAFLPSSDNKTSMNFCS